jgi:hypothetical protein
MGIEAQRMQIVSSVEPQRIRGRVRSVGVSVESQ